MNQLYAQREQLEEQAAQAQVKAIDLQIEAAKIAEGAGGAKVTPEAIVIDSTGTVRYRGAINNLYAGYGKKRRAATSHYLQDAVEAVLAGNTVKIPKTKPVGCFIHYAEK